MSFRSLLFLLLLPLAAGAQTATLVRDINQGDQNGTELIGFQDVTAVPGRVFFSATSPSAGASENREMWATDGTAEGTVLLKDVCSGPCGSDPQVLGSLTSVLFWAGKTDDGTFRLWRSDGTRPGTFRLLDAPIRYNGIGSYERHPISSVAGSFLYFAVATDGQDALWKTNGTLAGTQLVRTLDAGQRIDSLLTAGGTVFLIVRQNPVSGGDLTWSVWASDGTAAGTRVVHSFDRIQPKLPETAGSHLFFIASTLGAGYELWASDGTAAGTRAVTNFTPASPFGSEQSLGYFLGASAGRLFFVADDVIHGQELWASDGTPAGTRRITDFGTAEPGFGPVADLGGLVVFTAADGLGHDGVWTTNGDPASTRFQPLPCGTDCHETIRGFVKVGPRVVLFVEANYGLKVLSTDGTPAGTLLLRDGCNNDCNVILPDNLPQEAAVVRFAVHDDAIWRTDGTPAGTREEAVLPGAFLQSFDFQEAAAGPFTIVLGSYRREAAALWAVDTSGRTEPRLVKASAPNGPGLGANNLTPLQGNLAFTACEGESFYLWRSAGTEASTGTAVELYPPQDGASYCISTVGSGEMASLGSAVVFLQEKDFTRQKALWRSDGTPGGTQQLTPAGVSVSGPLTVGAGRVFFRATKDQTSSLWASDGTPAGTVVLATWPANTGSPSDLTVLGNELWFLFGGSAKQIWKSDGTPQGTRKVADGEASTTIPASFVRLGSKVYLNWRGNTFNDGIWMTDGTAAGTKALGPVNGMTNDPYPSELITFQGSLYFFAWTAFEVRGFWRSDGTAAGTTLLATFPDQSTAYPGVHHLTIAGPKLYFVARDGSDPGEHGTELWETDGTPAGTHLVRDVRPGTGSSSPADLTAAGSRLFFTAADETYGRELWVTDGTEAGTHLVQDVNPFGASSEPQLLTVAGDRLYFTADDGVSGREIWTLPLAGPTGCQPSSTRLCLNGGRYQVEAAWRTVSPQGVEAEGHGTGVPLSSDTGYFWFFSPANVEAVVKVLDGQGVNGHVWVFYGALSDVDYTITVTDTQTGVTRRYHNPPGQLASVGDTTGFGPLGAYSATPKTIEAPPSPLPVISERYDRAAAAPCQASAQHLCLNNNRFTLAVAWKDFQGHTGTGTAVPLTGDTGTFWFFNAANVELVVKILDGRPVNNKFWLFYGALSNVEYTLTVTDTETGTTRTYTNPSGRFASVADTNAF
jgi:ELWxxDGT repeat protein